MHYVLIPGAGGMAWYWHRVVAELRRRGHEATAVDLPADDRQSGLRDYADIVVKAIGGRPTVLVAQSLGGFTAPLVCERASIQRLILVNAMIPLPGETAGDWWETSGHSAIKQDVDLQRDFLHDLDPELIEESGRHARPEADIVFEEPCRFDAWPDIPTQVIMGSDDRFFPPDFQRRVALERLGIEPVQVPGGHLAALSRPKELTDEIARTERQPEWPR
jgi:pimeloyl-ACP methyl ester carboxylesterase